MKFALFALFLLNGLPSAYAQICSDQARAALEIQRQLYRANFSGPQRVVQINPQLAVQGTAREIEILRQMTYFGVPQIYTSPECGSVACYLKTVFGDEEVALRSLNFAYREEFVISLVAPSTPAAQQSTWSVQELRLLDTYIQYLPATFKNQLKGHFLHFARAKKLSSDSADADVTSTRAFANSKSQILVGNNLVTVPGQIVFLNSAFQEDHYSFPRALFHELGHQLDFATNVAQLGYTHQQMQFDKLTTWKEIGSRTHTYHNVSFESKIYDLSAQEKFVNAIAKINPSEDFAESISMYVEDPFEAKKLAPAKYDRIKQRVFGGFEFLLPRMELLGNIPNKSLLGACLQSVQEIRFVIPSRYAMFSIGGAFDPKLSSQCLKPYTETVIHARPELCEFEPQFLTKELFRSIRPYVDQVEASLALSLQSNLPKRHFECLNKKNASSLCRQEAIHFAPITELAISGESIKAHLLPKMKF